ncbi:hypothetical protein AMECASPLE_000019 [Ameca splendens]|uniref:Amino acid transporter n=1 Tax=Ameca splendens TaxID=208324 RepID=A0ABV0YW81_9TELE
MTNVILGLAGTTLSPSVTIARRAITYIVITTILSMLIGVFLVMLLKPGVKDHARAKVDDDDEVYTFFDALSDLIRNLIPRSLSVQHQAVQDSEGACKCGTRRFQLYPGGRHRSALSRQKHRWSQHAGIDCSVVFHWEDRREDWKC